MQGAAAFQPDDSAGGADHRIHARRRADVPSSREEMGGVEANADAAIPGLIEDLPQLLEGAAKAAARAAFEQDHRPVAFSYRGAEGPGDASTRLRPRAPHGA